MEKRKLGRTGLDVSRIALGASPFGSVNRANDWDPFSIEGRRIAIATIHRALDLGINYIDTAPAYGTGHSETLIGEVMKTRRHECVLATKVWFELNRQAVIASVHDSLKRLQSDYIDVVQVHGRMYPVAEYEHIVHGGPLDALRELRDAGKIGFIGITTEEPWTALQFLPHPEFDVYQIAYNFIYQAAARHFLIEAAKACAGVVTMRTMTSGVLQRAAGYLAPEWQAARDLYEVSLKFVLADSRVHSALIGMRWPEEVDRNIRLADNWQPPIDFATLPRLTVDVYKAEDAA
ncbi:MAG: aldo/keto reductase [Betaproteobacteria bacterium]|nr:aldo/keto reductase [Betaproteobacteria bacterium]